VASTALLAPALPATECVGTGRVHWVFVHACCRIAWYHRPHITYTLLILLKHVQTHRVHCRHIARTVADGGNGNNSTSNKARSGKGSHVITEYFESAGVCQICGDVSNGNLCNRHREGPAAAQVNGS
jgi:hypothetical protein